MAAPWADVENSHQYQALPDEQKHAAKQQYFDTVVAPRVPPAGLTTARTQFFNGPLAPPPLSPAQTMAKNTADSGFGNAAWQGGTFGFGDEIDAGATAAFTGAKNLVTGAFGQKPKYTAREAYDAVLNQERQNMADYEKQHPGWALGGQVLGGVMTGGKAGAGFIKDAETIAGRLGRSALVATGFGGVAGIGSGEGGAANRAKSGGIGAATGLALSPIPAVAAELLGPVARAGNYLKDTTVSVFKQLTGKTPDMASPSELQKYGGMAEDIVRDMIKSTGKTVEQLTDDPAFKMGKPVIAAEAIGRPAINQAASIARQSGITGDEIESKLRLRNQEQNGRLQENLAKATNLDVRHTQGHIEELVDDLQAKNAPQYKKAFSQPGPEVEDDKNFQNIASQPNFQEGFKIAKQAAANKQEAIALFPPSEEGGKWYGNPSWEHLDMIKKAMDSVITRKHTDSLGKFMSDFQSNADVEGAGNFRQWLFGGNKDYENAVDKAGDTITLKKAYDNAPRLMSPKTSEFQFDKAIRDLSPAEIEATKSGWVNDVYNQLQNGRLTPKDLNQNDFRAKATRILGESDARNFMDEVGQELRLRANADRMMPGRQSITGELAHAQTEMDLKTDQLLSDFANTMGRRGVKVAAISGAVSVVKSLIKDVRTPEQRAIRDEIGKLLLMKPNELQAKLSAADGKPESAFRTSQKMSPKARDVARMLLHVSTGPTAEAEVEGQNN